MSEVHYDFSGWATRNDLKCADGRTIRRNAFKDCDGMVVPLVWSHEHDSPANVIGHALLENRDEGVYTYGSFNNTDIGQHAKELVRHGDITSLSIYANKLKQTPSKDVLHGIIREVSLVMAGANPGAFIDVPVLSHSEDGSEIYGDEAFIYTGEDLDLEDGVLNIMIHGIDDVPQQPVMPAPMPMPAYAQEPDTLIHEEAPDMNNATLKDVLSTLNEEQMNAVSYILGELTDDEEDGNSMKHNAFENDTPQNTLSHADMETIFNDAHTIGSLKETVRRHQESGVLAHALYNDDGTEQTYGVANIDYLFPEAKLLNNGAPEFIKRDQGWVKVVMNGVKRTPFSRIKSQFANITMDEARAKGYIKGNRKKEEVFSLLKRTTTPQTIYKKQKLDRDDVIDITDFDTVAWIKGEMRLMLEEEAARAMLVGDGRLSSDEDKIDPTHIRPIYGEDDLYAFKVHVSRGQDNGVTVKNMIRALLKARKNYRGSGDLTFFTTEDWLAEALLLEDGFGHSLYKTEDELATKMRVKRIVTVPVMEGITSGGEELMGIAVDLDDYTVGADKGGAVNMFDDFDIDFNQMKYLIESRFCGALTKPFSAMVVVIGGSSPTYTEATVTSSSTPKASGWYIKEGDIYLLTKDETPVVIGQDSDEHDIYRTYYVKS